MEPPGEQAVAAAPADARAFGRLFDQHLPRVYAFVARRVADRQVAEELTAAVFARALEAFRSGSLVDATFGGFVHLVASSALVDHELRNRRQIPAGVRASDVRHAGDADAAEVADELAARAFASAIDRDALRRSLQDLPDRQRRVILLKYLDGLDPEEQCSVLRCSRQELAIELHRALRALRGLADQEASGAA